MADEKIIGVISDTHGLLRASVLDHFRDCNLILHAGDIGDLGILDELHTVAEVHAVRGNIDQEPGAHNLKSVEQIEFYDQKILIIHNLHSLRLDLKKMGINIVIFGHSHQPKIEYQDDILFFNPGSAGPKRFQLPICVGKITFSENQVLPQIVLLE